MSPNLNNTKSHRKGFGDWLRTQGADVLEVTSPWEFARFRANSMLHIIYVDKAGTVNTGEFALECLAAWRRNANVPMGFTSKRKSLGANMRATLAARDGTECFFCGAEMKPEEMTIEHLVGKNKGGTDHSDNLVLAHEKCNQGIGAIPLVAKIEIHVKMRIEQETTKAKDHKNEG